MSLGGDVLDVAVLAAGGRTGTVTSTVLLTLIVLAVCAASVVGLVTRVQRLLDRRLAWQPRLRAAEGACYSASGIALPTFLALESWGVVAGPLSLLLAAAFIALVLAGFAIGAITRAIGHRVGQEADGLALSEAVRRAATTGLKHTGEAWNAARTVGGRPAEPSWYGPHIGRWLLGGGCFAVLIAGVFVEMMISRGAASDMIRQYGVLYGLALLFSVTVPAVLAWVLLGLAHGQPRIRASIARLAGCSGGGVVIGFLVATAGFFWHRFLELSATNVASFGSPVTDRAAFTVATFVNVSTLGAVAGYALGLVLVVHDSGQVLPNRLLGWIGVPVCWGGVGAVALVSVPPASVLDGLVDGFAASTPNPSDWQRVLLADRAAILSSAPSSGTVVILMVLASTIVSAASWYSWNHFRTNRIATLDWPRETLDYDRAAGTADTEDARE